MRRVRPRRPAPEDLPEPLAAERDLVRRTLGRRWPQALAAAVGRWLLDFLTLQAALEAVGARPPLSLPPLPDCAAPPLARPARVLRGPAPRPGPDHARRPRRRGGRAGRDARARRRAGPGRRGR